YGDPLGISDPDERGMLFFQNRTTALSMGNQPGWQGGGNFFLAGHLYFHHTAYSHQFTFGANGSSGYFSGCIVTDMFNLGGSANLTMYLSPNTGLPSVKASLLR